MNSVVRAIDSIPVVPLLEPVIQKMTSFRLSYFFWKQVQLPLIHPWDLTSAVGTKERWEKFKELLSVDLSFLRHNWKQGIAYIFASRLRDKASLFIANNLFAKAVYGSHFRASKEDCGFLEKIRLIFPAIMIPAITVGAQALSQASHSFLATRRGAPWTTLLAAYSILNLQTFAISSLSISSSNFISDEGSLFNLGDGLKSMIFSAEDLGKIKDPRLKFRVKKVTAIAGLCFACAMTLKSFSGKSPFWINTAHFLLLGITEQIANKVFLKYNHIKSRFQF